MEKIIYSCDNCDMVLDVDHNHLTLSNAVYETQVLDFCSKCFIDLINALNGSLSLPSIRLTKQD